MEVRGSELAELLELDVETGGAHAVDEIVELGDTRSGVPDRVGDERLDEHPDLGERGARRRGDVLEGLGDGFGTRGSDEPGAVGLGDDHRQGVSHDVVHVLGDAVPFLRDEQVDLGGCAARPSACARSVSFRSFCCHARPKKPSSQAPTAEDRDGEDHDAVGDDACRRRSARRRRRWVAYQSSRGPRPMSSPATATASPIAKANDSARQRSRMLALTPITTMRSRRDRPVRRREPGGDEKTVVRHDDGADRHRDERPDPGDGDGERDARSAAHQGSAQAKGTGKDLMPSRPRRSAQNTKKAMATIGSSSADRGGGACPCPSR